MKELRLTKADSVVLALLRSALFDNSLDVESLESLTPGDWQSVFRQSVRQGVSAIVLDTISSSPVATSIPKVLALKWMSGVVSIEGRNAHQKEVGAEVAELLAAEGINSPILKGLALASYYPHPEHRECGDIDLYSGEKHLEVDSILAKAGADVKDDYYTHSHITFKGVTIENHRFFNPIRGSRSRKKLEQHFIELMNAGGATWRFVPDTKLVIPSADFNALFLTMHALKHFILEGGIRLRHLTDWAMFLKAEQNNVNWTEFYAWTDKMHFSRFANAMTALSVKYLGVKTTATGLSAESQCADLLLEDMLHPVVKPQPKGQSLLRMRFGLVRGVFRSLWKYHKIYQKSALLCVTGLGLGLLCEKNPKI